MKSQSTWKCSYLSRKARFLEVVVCSLTVCLLGPICAFGAFGLTDSNGYYTVDTGGGLVFTVNQANGDITSLKYNNVEYQEPTKGSQVNSGFGTATVTATTYGNSYIKITVVNSTGTLTHYYVARNGYNNIYMATYFTQEPSLGLVRYIVRIPSSLLPNGPNPSDIRNNTGAIEVSDIFGMSDGTTRSKHYSNHRLIDWLYTGATGQNVGVFMVRSNHEGDSGGPFYRCLINQCGADQEIYEIINYGEVQTEAFRTSILNGPYTLVFTNGSQPTLPLDTSWLSNLDLLGYVPQWNRNYVKGKANGIPNGFQGVVGFANSKAQYWCTVSNSNYWSPWMIPGIYTETLYKGELAVATQSVAVPASETPVIQNIASAEFSPVYIWRIGQWDGTPSGFLNADKVTTMHPSDVRMASWKPVTYTVGSSSDSSFPCYQWKYVNNPTTIKFNLSSNQVTAHTLRIGITTAYAGGRPRVSVNSWTSSRPSTSIPQPHTRSLTIGSYRGNNTTFTYAIPASAFVAGTNTLMINVISISENTGYLSAGYAYDCVELDN